LPTFVQEIIGSGWGRDDALERRFGKEEIGVGDVGGGGGHQVVVLGQHGVSSVSIVATPEAKAGLEVRLVLHLLVT